MTIFLITLINKVGIASEIVDRMAADTFEKAHEYAVKEYGLNHSCSEMLKQDSFVEIERPDRTTYTIEIDEINKVEGQQI